MKPSEWAEAVIASILATLPYAGSPEAALWAGARLIEQAIEASVAAERERIAADLIKQGERTYSDFAEAMEWAAERIREGK